MQSVTSDILEKEFEKADINNDGKIDRIEFTTLYNSLVNTRVPSWEGEQEYCIVMPAFSKKIDKKKEIYITSWLCIRRLNNFFPVRNTNTKNISS